MPFLSVITINRNNAAGLRGTIESVLTQTGVAVGDLEYIVIDGASTDGSADVIKEYSAREDLPHKIAYWVNEPDTGIYNAMNKGIRHAHGDYVAILNSGDYYVKDALTGLKEIAQEHRGAILYGAVDCIKGGEFIRTWGVNANGLPRNGIPHQGSFIPKTAFDTYGLYDESFKIRADYDSFCMFKEKGVHFFHVPKIIALYDLSGISSSGLKLGDDEKTRIWIKYGVVKKHDVAGKIKSIIKLFVPYGLLVMARKIKRGLQAHRP